MKVHNINMICIKAFIPSYWGFRLIRATMEVGDKLVGCMSDDIVEVYHVEQNGQLFSSKFTEEELTNFVSEREYKLNIIGL